MPSLDWFLDILASAAPDGVYRSAEHGDPLMTLCSAATDLAAGRVTAVGEFAAGVPELQELDLNPVIASEGGLLPADVRVVLDAALVPTR